MRFIVVQLVVLKYNEDGMKVAKEGDQTWHEDLRSYQPIIRKAV